MRLLTSAATPSRDTSLHGRFNLQNRDGRIQGVCHCCDETRGIAYWLRKMEDLGESVLQVTGHIIPSSRIQLLNEVPLLMWRFFIYASRAEISATIEMTSKR